MKHFQFLTVAYTTIFTLLISCTLMSCNSGYNAEKCDGENHYLTDLGFCLWYDGNYGNDFGEALDSILYLYEIDLAEYNNYVFTYDTLQVTNHPDKANRKFIYVLLEILDESYIDKYGYGYIFNTTVIDTKGDLYYISTPED